jgi:fatty acid desaturase
VSTPPIAIRCDCGESGSVPYGETWECASCGKRWNTSQIPREAYERRNRRMRRFKLELLVFAAILLAVFAPLVLFVESGYLFLALVVGLAWMFLYMPLWRRRVRRAVAEAPSWELHPE